MSHSTSGRLGSHAGPNRSSFMTRRGLLAGFGALALSGCVSTPQAPAPVVAPPTPPAPPAPPRVTPLMYQAITDEPFPIPAVDVSRLEERWWREEDVHYPTREPRGTVVVDTGAKYLYHVRGENRADRYGIGVGRQGFAWEGRATIAYKRKWPRWTPPDSMVARQPELEPYSIANGGMDPGPTNPMGARGLYIHQNGVDTIYRIHGTHQPWSIGRAVSSGCIRLLNHDVIHLYDRVRDGSQLVVIHDGSDRILEA